MTEKEKNEIIQYLTSKYPNVDTKQLTLMQKF